MVTTLQTQTGKAWIDDYTVYEVFLHDKTLSINQMTLRQHTLLANFGDGYGAGINSGNVSGLRTWSLEATAIPDSLDYMVDFYYGGAQSETRYDYLLEFWQRHITTGNKPFYMIDYHITDPVVWLVSFANPSIPFQIFASQLYGGGGVTVKQRRVPGLQFNTDGSVDTSSMIPANFTATTNAKTIDLAWDANSNADGYEIELQERIGFRKRQIIDNGATVTYADTNLDDGTYSYRVRSYNDEGLRGVWSAVASDTVV